MNNDNNDEYDDVLSALAVSNIISQIEPEKEIVKKEYDEMDELSKTLKDLDDLIKTNSAVLEEAKRLVETTGDAEYLEAYSNIGKAQSEALKNKVKILTEKEKNKITEKTKTREIDIKERLADYTINKNAPEALPAGTTLNQTNVIMSGSREEMFDMIMKMKEKELNIVEANKV
jgi:hypothetical protein